jgi:ATP-dependent Lhr-like helicase
VNRGGGIQWCDRRLLARIHRYTLNRLRAEIEPVSPADFMRFLFAWQHVDAVHRLSGIDGLRSVLEQLDGFELAADGWERAVLPARVDGYDASMIDTLCLTGEVGWARLSAPTVEATQVVPATPVALFLRGHAEAWAALKGPGSPGRGTREGGCATSTPRADLSTPRRDLKVAQPVRAAETSAEPSDSSRAFSETAERVLHHLRARGALFEHELAGASGSDQTAVRAALRDLVAAGLVASDGFGGLRSIIRSSSGRPGSVGRRSSIAGRWSLLRDAEAGSDTQSAIELQARTLLKRYGVVFRRLLAREANVAPWRDLARVYRRLEARGEIRGGRFVAGMSGEQFARADAVERLREVRRTPASGRCLAISAADPLNLAGLVTAGDRVRAVAANRLVYRDGVPIAALEGEYVRSLAEVEPAIASDAARALTGNPALSVVSGFVGR